jgi:Lrp/AsnC family leucine-responsive transcriptional regulator
LRRSGELDDKDLRILEALQANARVPLSKLGRSIGLSQPAISERVQRLEDAGIIRGYGARIDARALGLGLTAIVRLRTTNDQVKACFKKFGEIPQIIEIYRVTGEDCFVLKVLVPRSEDLEAIVDRIASYGTATTALVLRSEPPRAIGRELLGHRPRQGSARSGRHSSERPAPHR